MHPPEDIDHPLREELLAMARTDEQVRSELEADGSLFDGYNPRMEFVHRRHAARLREIIREFGWPGHHLVGEDGARSAWLIAQHSIGEPDLLRDCLARLRVAEKKGDVPAWQVAYLDDRIRMYEGRPQRYGTQFDIDEDGTAVPYIIEEPETVDERRQSMGLESLVERMRNIPCATPLDSETRAKRQIEFEKWLYRVGWRK